jgi:asparagine synthetase B (glutamine-hydrolysing)
MLESSLTIENFYWDGDTFRPTLPTDLAPAGRDELVRALARIDGQFAIARQDGPRTLLARGKRGVNKLFFAIRSDGTVVTGNYVIDLIRQGVPFAAIYSVPSGHFTIIDAERQSLDTVRYHEPAIRPQLGSPARIRDALETWFGRMARDLGDREVRLCLSGGIDSSLIGIMACLHFDKVTAYTYGYVDDVYENAESDDVVHARRMAQHLSIPLHFVPATRDDILGCIDDALVYGQDWRDFNVHCAIVNLLLARAMAAHGGTSLLMTGDQMNEIVADYTPVEYGGQQYYRLPKLSPDALRLALMAGLDSGDREVGVFHHHGLAAMQPYGLVVDEYCGVPSLELARAGGKQALVDKIAGDLLPTFIRDRRKVRAQIGMADRPTGILPLLIDSGHDAAWLKTAWRERFGVDDIRRQNLFIRDGIYKWAKALPRSSQDGYLTD